MAQERTRLVGSDTEHTDNTKTGEQAEEAMKRTEDTRSTAKGPSYLYLRSQGKRDRDRSNIQRENCQGSQTEERHQPPYSRGRMKTHVRLQAHTAHACTCTHRHASHTGHVIIKTQKNKNKREIRKAAVAGGEGWEETPPSKEQYVV